MTAVDFDRAITRQEELIDEVRGLRANSRRLNAIMGFIILMLIGLGALTVIALQAVHNANEANQHIAQVVAQAEETRTAQALEACQLRNNTPRALRDALNADIDATETLLRANPDVESAGIDSYVASRREAIPPVEETDRDCNDDNRISAEDYPPD